MLNHGISEKEARELRKKFGENILPLKEKISWLTILVSQLESPLIIILGAAGLISLFFHEYIDTALIFTVLIVDVLMGFSQEHSAQKTLAALRKILKPETMVIRGGDRKIIEVKDLVPGDVVVLSGGDRVPADGQIIDGISLLVNESILTGEEEAVEKSARAEKPFLFMGTTIIFGQGLMRVTKIGRETEIGKIGQSLSEIKKEKTPLQLQLEKFTKSLALIIIGVCLVVFFVGVLRAEDVIYMARFSIILSIAAIPEGLPVAVTIILAIGMRRVLKKKGLVKRLLSIETLGSTSVICTDKTGTLTEGIMKVVRTDFKDKEKALFAIAFLNNRKSSIEIALWEHLKKEAMFNVQQLQERAEKVHEEPFDSEKKYSSVVIKKDGKETAFLMGAPEIVLSFCKIPAAEKNKALGQIDKWADEGLRVLGLATKEQSEIREKKEFSWQGMIAVQDPIREGAKEAIEIAKGAGIKVKIVTGDYRKTAERVAMNLGFKIAPENVLEGAELEEISKEELREKIDSILLFTRVTPHQKLKIIKVLQEKGEIVAMTGDGVNDAPALKKADIGVVVGTASDVAKEAGDLILIDSNFKTIVAACEEGRLIFANIKKVVAYVLSNAFSEIILIFGALVLDLPTPLTVVQILWIHLICDGPPDIMLSFEPKEKGILAQKPKNIEKESILSGKIKFLIFAISAMTGLLALMFFWYFQGAGEDIKLARTIAFAIVATVSLVYIFAFKNLNKLIVQTENFFENKYLFLGVLYGFVLVFAAVYLPVFNQILGTVPLNLSHWILIFGVAIIATLWTELIKFLKIEKGGILKVNVKI